MWAWFFGGYAVFVAVLISCAVRVALTCEDKERREMAFRVLKLVWGTGTGGTLITALVLLSQHQLL
jgi:hypothetical protein